MTDFSTLKISHQDGVATIAFNRPDSLNAINTTMRREFVTAARQLNLDDSVKLVVLTGEGRAFGSGADLAEDDGSGGLLVGERTRDDLIHEFKPGVLAVAEGSKVWVAAINGPCAGVSYSYAMACDFVLMSDAAYLYQPFAVIGLIPDGGSTWLLQKLVGDRRAFELMILGEKLGADKALDWGLANRVFPAESFAEEVQAFAADVAGRSPLALRHTKQALRFAHTASLGDSINKEAYLQEQCIASEDCKNAVAAFFSKQPYEWKGR